jgi:membrane-bound lytic murein transglycosylase MltF
VLFTQPYLSNVSEVVVRHKSVSGLKAVEDLAGREVYVRPKSSYVTHLAALNRRFKKEKRPLIKIVEADKILATEDILEMVHAGIVKVTVADAHIAQAWEKVLTDIRIENNIIVHHGGNIAWAVRKDNPELRADIDRFTKQIKKGSLLGNILFKRYYEQSKWINNPLTESKRRRLEALVGLFTKYADRYGFDWLAVAAQAYQESELDQKKKSPSGAVGIMQLLPSTAAGDPINIKQIEKLENNIHAGVKYLHFLRKRYFSDPNMAPSARVDFSWAAYNAGPARINSLRRLAAERGMDPNRWFGHVERVAAEKIGREPVTYVANINKYYIAYKLYMRKTVARQKTRKTIESHGKSP